MPSNEIRGPFCQSCSMPLNHPEDFGTDPHGYRINDFCRHCYAAGRFTDPSITLDQMIDRCVGIMAGQGIMPAGEARALLNRTMPGLKRWKRAEVAPV